MTVPLLDSSDVVATVFALLSGDSTLGTLLSSSGSGTEKIRHARIQVPTSSPLVSFFVVSETADPSGNGWTCLLQVDCWARANVVVPLDAADPFTLVRDLRRRVRALLLTEEDRDSRLLTIRTSPCSRALVELDVGFPFDSEQDGEWARTGDTYRFTYSRR